MPDADHELYEYAAENRARLEIIGAEQQRIRDRLHDLSNELATLRLLGKAVEQLAHDVRDMSERIEPVVRRAVRRPTPTTAQTLAAYLAVAVALIALIVSVTHHH